MADIGSLTFDLTDCTQRKWGDDERVWTSAENVVHLLRFWLGPSEWWPFDLTDLPAGREFFEKQSSDAGGALLSLEVTTVAGAEALRGLFKYRSPFPDSAGMYYAGVLWLPFEECLYQLNLEAVETETTGVREAAVMMIMGDAWPRPQQDEIPIINSPEELEALLASTPASKLPSDDEQYDSTFPGHPLSLVRTRLAEICRTAKFDTNTEELRPFRVGK